MASGKFAPFFEVVSLTRFAIIYHKRVLYNHKNIWKNWKFTFTNIHTRLFRLVFEASLKYWKIRKESIDFIYVTYIIVVPSCCLFPDNIWIHRFNSSNIRVLAVNLGWINMLTLCIIKSVIISKILLSICKE